MKMPIESLTAGLNERNGDDALTISAKARKEGQNRQSDEAGCQEGYDLLNWQELEGHD